MFTQVKEGGVGVWEMCRSLVIQGIARENFLEEKVCAEKVIFIHSFNPHTPQANHKLSTIVIKSK
jgi:hypothetical protein